LDIVLPSGLVYHFTFIETIDKTEEEFDIVITTFNTATEAGWYQAILTGEFFANQNNCYDTDIIEFDPPTGKGEGNPTASLDVVT
jgi:hypothetical protein